MIVLAIAGVFLLLIFSVVPILSRNSRNNQRTQDVTAILQAVSRYQLNNSANFPTIDDDPLNGTTLSYYDVAAKQVTFTSQAGKTPVDQPAHTAVDPGPSAAEPIDWVEIVDYEKCVDDGSGKASKNGADYTDIVALYAIETGGGSAPRCLQL